MTIHVDIDAWDRLADALEYPSDAPAAVQERYVEAFDLDPACTLDVGWHLFGDAPERGVFLSMLREDLAHAGVYERGNLPDHLPTLLRLIARQDEETASALAAIVAPAVAHVHQRLTARGSPFADVIGTVGRRLDDRRRHEERP
jgi:nitrate reductase molybdenum cofactor assembly chaperone NarJ/NarW